MPFSSEESSAVLDGAALFISDPNRPRGFRPEVLRDLYSLTPAEIRIAILQTTGKSLPELADSLCVSHETVRSHVKGVMHKTGTTLQAELANLLSNLGNVMS